MYNNAAVAFLHEREVFMTRQEMIAKLRRLHTLLIIEKRSNNLALALRRAIDFIGTWKDDPDRVSSKISTRRLFAGYGPKFFRIYDEILATQTCWMLDELQPKHNPFFCALCEIPSIGVVMAQRMYFDRSICTPEDLQIAYSNKILEKIPAFGEQRLKAIEEWLLNPPDFFPSRTDENIGETAAADASSNDRSRRNAKIFQSAVFRAVGGSGENNAPTQNERIPGRYSAAARKLAPDQIETPADPPETCGGGIEEERDCDESDELRAIVGGDIPPAIRKPEIPSPSRCARELEDLSEYPDAGREPRRANAETEKTQTIASGRPAQLDQSDRDIARDLQNQSICCSKFVCANLQANKIIARCVFAHTIQCDKIIAHAMTVISDDLWELRRKSLSAENGNDSWEGAQSENVMANQIDAQTIQAGAIAAHRIYCVRCDCPMQSIESKI